MTELFKRRDEYLQILRIVPQTTEEDFNTFFADVNDSPFWKPLSQFIPTDVDKNNILEPVKFVFTEMGLFVWIEPPFPTYIPEEQKSYQLQRGSYTVLYPGYVITHKVDEHSIYGHLYHVYTSIEQALGNEYKPYKNYRK